jgi:hypothetical protein
MATAFGQAINANTAGGAVSVLTSAGITTSNSQLIVLGIEVAATAQTVGSVADFYGNTWIAGPTLVSSPGVIYSYYAQNIVGGAGHTFTVNIAGGTANLSFVAATATGCALSSALDQSATWANTGFFNDHPHTAASFTGTAAVTTGFDGEIVFAFNASVGANAADTFTAGSGWTIPTNGQNPGNGASYSPSMLQYQANVSIGAYTDNYSTVNFVRAAGLLMSFKAAAGGGAGAGLMLSTLGVG